MKALRLGIVGCGAVTERYHLPALLPLPDLRLAAFVDPAIDRARRTRIRYVLRESVLFPATAILGGK